ncbi:MAG: 6-bladed beta-propeller [Acidobacteriota bacterium]|nr:6-bladed beta-propeller [Acidobacteriota bacterium]
MKKTRAAIILAAVYYLSPGGCSRNPSIPMEIIEITPLLELNAVIPDYKIMPFFNLFQNMAIDQQGNIYYLKFGHDRIQKFDKTGRLAADIGGIGQEADAFFSPTAILVENDSLYVLNDAGRQVKIFNLDGEFKSSFKIDNSWPPTSLCVDREAIYVNVIDKSNKTRNDGKLISVYDHEGRLVKKIGPIIKCNSMIGYNTFNRIRMIARDENIYYAFINQPLISWSGKNGGRTAVLDLRKFGIPVIDAIAGRIDAEGIDTPETFKDDSVSSGTCISFCSGFAVDEAGRIFYIPNTAGSGSRDEWDNSILLFNENHKLSKKIYLKTGKETVTPRDFLIAGGKAIYGIGTIKERSILFKF